MAKSDSSTGIAQGGVFGDIYCTNTCNPVSYTGWVEFLPGGLITCGGGFHVSPGDNIYVEVDNDGVSGGDSSHYRIHVTDTTNGWACNADQVMSMGKPYFADYIVERPAYTIDNAITATFSTSCGNCVWFHHAWLYYSGNIHSITDPLSYGLYIWYNNFHNVDVGAISSDPGGYGEFEAQWNPACTATASPVRGISSVTPQFSTSCVGGTSPYSYDWLFMDGTGAQAYTQTTSYTYYCLGICGATFYPVVIITDKNGIQYMPSVPSIYVYCRSGCANTPSP